MGHASPGGAPAGAGTLPMVPLQWHIPVSSSQMPARELRDVLSLSFLYASKPVQAMPIITLPGAPPPPPKPLCPTFLAGQGREQASRYASEPADLIMQGLIPL